MTAMGKGVGPPWSQAAGRAGSPSSAYDRAHYATDNAQPPGRPGAGRGPPGPGSFPGNQGGGRRGRGQKGGSGGSPIQMVRAALRITTGEQDFTIPGFGIPVGAFFVIGEAQVEATATDRCSWSYGMADGTTSGCMSGWSQHNSATSNTALRATQDEIFMILDSGSGVVDAEANFVSFIPNGVRINVTVVGNPNARLLTVYLIGGEGVSCEVNAFTPPAGNATVTYTPGFTTHGLILMNNENNWNDTGTAQNICRFGFAGYDGVDVTQCSLDWQDIDNAALMDIQARLATGKVASLRAVGDAHMTMGNVTATSFDLTAGPTDLSSFVEFYMAIGCGPNGKGWAGIQDTPTTPGKHAFTGAGFKPAFGFMVPMMVAAVNSDITDGDAGAFAFAGFSADDEFCNSWASEDVITTSNGQSISTNQAIDLEFDSGAGLKAFEATFFSFTNDGVKLNFSTVDSTVRKWPTLFLTT